MEITEVKIFPVGEDKLKAFVSVVLDQCFMVNDIKIIRGKDGLFISMPSRRKRNGKFKDIAHPLNNETRRMMEDRILSEYEKVAAGEGGETRRPRQARAEESTEPPAEKEQAEGDEEKSLEEVAEMHLRDSFWTT